MVVNNVDRITENEEYGKNKESVSSGDGSTDRSIKIVNSGDLESPIPSLPFSDYYMLYLALAVPVIINKRKKE